MSDDDAADSQVAAKTTADAAPRPVPARRRAALSAGRRTLDILKGAELALWPGQSVALVAPSGAGKSTLLHVAGLLEHPDAGEVYIDEIATSTLSDAERTRIRRTEIGFVYQFHHLLPEFSAIENVMLPQMIRGLSTREAATRATELLSYLGPQGAPDAPAGGTLGRRAAAGRDRARGRQRAAHPAGRRADRKSRPAHRRPRVRRADAAGARLRARGDRRHPQHGDRRPHGPPRHHARRAGGRTGLDGRDWLMRVAARTHRLRRQIQLNHVGLQRHSGTRAIN